MDREPLHHCGECVFCLSVCPACGSTDVDVRLATAYGYRNEEPNRMQLWRAEQLASMHCCRCGGNFPPDHPDMGRLARAAAAAIGLAPCVELDADESGVIRRRAFLLRPGRGSTGGRHLHTKEPPRRNEAVMDDLYTNAGWKEGPEHSPVAESASPVLGEIAAGGGRRRAPVISGKQ